MLCDNPHVLQKEQVQAVATSVPFMQELLIELLLVNKQLMYQILLRLKDNFYSDYMTLFVESEHFANVGLSICLLVDET